jgi:hypothetical protein
MFAAGATAVGWEATEIRYVRRDTPNAVAAGSVELSPIGGDGSDEIRADGVTNIFCVTCFVGLYTSDLKYKDFSVRTSLCSLDPLRNTLHQKSCLLAESESTTNNRPENDEIVYDNVP